MSLEVVVTQKLTRGKFLLKRVGYAVGPVPREARMRPLGDFAECAPSQVVIEPGSRMAWIWALEGDADLVEHPLAEPGLADHHHRFEVMGQAPQVALLSLGEVHRDLLPPAFGTT